MLPVPRKEGPEAANRWQHPRSYPQGARLGNVVGDGGARNGNARSASFELVSLFPFREYIGRFAVAIGVSTARSVVGRHRDAEAGDAHRAGEDDCLADALAAAVAWPGWRPGSGAAIARDTPDRKSA